MRMSVWSSDVCSTYHPGSQRRAATRVPSVSAIHSFSRTFTDGTRTACPLKLMTRACHPPGGEHLLQPAEPHLRHRLQQEVGVIVEGRRQHPRLRPEAPHAADRKSDV